VNHFANLIDGNVSSGVPIRIIEMFEIVQVTKSDYIKLARPVTDQTPFLAQSERASQPRLVISKCCLPKFGDETLKSLNGFIQVH
jgi:hypothetical protein